MIDRLALAVALVLCPGAAAAQAGCLTDAQVDAAVGDHVRSGAAFSGRGGLPDLPLCSGLTLAQQIQRIHAAAFPEEQRLADQRQAALVAREDEDARLEEADRLAAAPDVAWPVDPEPARFRSPVPAVAVRRTKVRAAAPAQPAQAKPARAKPAHAKPAAVRSSYSSCAQARAAGAAPLRRGQPGYASRLDRDDDGIACE